MKRFFLLLTLTLIPGLAALAQELNCTISLRTDQIKVNQQSNNAQQIYSELQRAMADFVNGRRWTNDQFRQEEKIRLDISINLQKATADGNYDGQAMIQINRPVFGTNYETVLLKFVDRSFSFQYQPNNPLNFNENTFTNNLTSLLAYYSYLALALDYDSFGRRGGDVWIQRAYNVANLASSGGATGWDSRGDQRSRYWLIDDLQNQQMVPFREGLYTYHRLALDTMLDQPDQSRKQILAVLNDLRGVNQQKPATLLLNSFFDAKSEELYQIFSKGMPADKSQAYQVLSQLDPTKADLYRRLVR